MTLPASADFYDPSAEFLKAKNGYESKRGYVTSGLRPNWTIPNTTWGDVYAFIVAWSDWIDPTKCMARLPPGLYTGDECTPKGTASLQRATSNWTNTWPDKKGSLQWVGQQIDANTIYPWNDQFWTYGQQYALELSSDLNLPTSLDNMFEAIHESILELPATIRDALSRADPRQLLPDVSLWASLLKWATIGGGLFMLYWYVLKPKKS